MADDTITWTMVLTPQTVVVASTTWVYVPRKAGPLPESLSCEVLNLRPLIYNPANFCPGIPEIWDQTVGCPVCDMNVWQWDGDHDVEEQMARFSEQHPWDEDSCRDYGDEDDAGPWAEVINEARTGELSAQG